MNEADEQPARVSVDPQVVLPGADGGTQAQAPAQEVPGDLDALITRSLRDLGARADAAIDDGVRACGPFTLLDVLGQGGFGIVYAAVQEHPIARRVAIKVIRAGLATEDVLRRFALEERALARIDHPCVAGILEAGTTEDGRPWFAMPLIEGDSIVMACAAHNATLRQRVELMADVCDGVHAAHVQGILHRDIKPSNVLVCRRGDGVLTPKVIDFGIAKAIDPSDADAAVTRTGQGRVAGTLAYMAPEQMDSSRPGADVRTDVFALGVVLYELVSGEAPTASGPLSRLGPLRTPARGVAALRDDASGSSGTCPARGAVHTARSDRALHGDLDAIIARATMPEPELRYQSADALEADLRRALNHEPVSARAPSRWYTMSRSLRPYRGVLIAVAAGLMITIALAIVAGVSAVRANRSQREANARASQVKQVNGLLEGMFLRIDARSAQAPDPTLLLPMLDATSRHLVGAAETMHPVVVADAARTVGAAYIRIDEPQRAIDMAERLLGLLRAREDLERSDEMISSIAQLMILRGDGVLQAWRLAGGIVTMSKPEDPLLADWRQAMRLLRAHGLEESDAALRAAVRLWSARVGLEEGSGEDRAMLMTSWLDERMESLDRMDLEYWRYQVRRAEMTSYQNLLANYPAVVQGFAEAFGIDHPEVLRVRARHVRFIVAAAMDSQLHEAPPTGMPYLRGEELRRYFESAIQMSDTLIGEATMVLGPTHSTTMEARLWNLTAYGQVHGAAAAKERFDGLMRDAQSLKVGQAEMIRNLRSTWDGFVIGPAAGVWWN